MKRSYMAMLWPLFLPSRHVLVLWRPLKGGSGRDLGKECADLRKDFLLTTACEGRLASFGS